MDIKVKNILKNYGDVEVIKGIDLDIKSGELLSLLGPSGCGKSTMLFMLSGLESVTSGNIYFGDKDVTELGADKRNIGLVFQNYALYPHMTVLKNVMYPLLNRKVPKKEAEVEALKIIKSVNLEEHANKKPGQLSGGQQQRVAIARAIVKKPEVLLLDEPISNLDAKLKEKTIKEIRDIQKKNNITTVFVTHDQQEALAVSDRIVILDKGKVQQIGSPNELYRNPSNLYVAKFIGTPSINLIDIEVENYKIINFENIIKEEVKIKDGKYKLGIRPESVIIGDGDEVEIIEKEILGRDVLCRLIYKDYEINAIARNSIQIENKQHGKIIIDLKDILLFDIKTGERIKL